MTGDGPKIVISGVRKDWSGGTRPLTARAPSRNPNGRTLWFGAEFDPDGSQVWFWISSEAIGRMREKTPHGRGDRLIDTLLAWLTPDRRPGPDLNHFHVRVWPDGDPWIEPYYGNLMPLPRSAPPRSV